MIGQTWQMEPSAALLVDDVSDERIEVFLGLRDKALRQRREAPGGDMDGVFIAEGDIVIERAAAAGYRLESVLIDAARARPLPSVVAASPVYAATPEVLDEIAGFGSYRGALGCFARRPVPSAEDVLADATLRSFAVVEGVNNPTNLGVLLRSASAFGIDALLLSPGSCDPLSRRCCRVSMGEGFAMAHAWLPEFPAGLDVLAGHDVEVWALTPSQDAEDISTLAVDPGQRVGLLIGAEGPGLSEGALAAARRRVRIPMSGAVDSLNAGAASAVGFYALQQARRAEDRP